MEAFTLSTSAYLGLQGITLLLTPGLIVSMTVSEPRRITDLETYLCRSFGLTFLALAALILFLTNVLPVTSTPPSDSDAVETPSNPYAYPTVLVMTTYHAFTAFYLYTQLTYARNFAFTVGCVGSTALFGIGMWTILFGGGKGRFSKTTGADKHTANFPFSNKESAKAQKKDYKDKEKRKSLPKTTRSSKDL